MTYRFRNVDPVTLPRHCGGWLAMTPLGVALRIGVTADTEAAARQALAAALERWEAILNDEVGHQPGRPVTLAPGAARQ